MKKTLALLLSAASAAALLFSYACKSEPEKKPPMVISGNISAPPANWYEEGKFQGIGFDMAKIALEGAGVDYLVAGYAPWKETVEMAEDGRIDMLVAVFKNEQRAKYFEFSEPYLNVPIVVCVRNGKEFPFSRWDDLKGKKGLIGSGESYGWDFDNFASTQLNVERYPVDVCLGKLAAGEADYLIVNMHAGSIMAFSAGVMNKVKFLDVPVTIMSYHMAISKRSAYLSALPEINRIIKEACLDNTPEKFAKKYMIMWRGRHIQSIDTSTTRQNEMN